METLINPIAIWSKQAEFIADKTTPIVGFVGGRGSSKTRSAAIKILEDARRDWPVAAVSPDFKVITETSMPTFIEVAKQYGAYIRDKLSPVPMVEFKTKDGGIANIVFRSGMNPETLRGPSKRLLWIDEASVVKSAVLEIGSAVMRWRGVMGQILLTFTPRGKRHWTFDVFFSKVHEAQIPRLEAEGKTIQWMDGIPYARNDNRKLIQARSSENPFLPPEFEKVVGSTSTAMFNRQELGGEFIDIAGLIFLRENFGPIVDESPANCLRVRYWDKAATHGSGCYTSGCLMAYSYETKLFYIEDVVRGQWGYRERDNIIADTAYEDAAKHGNSVIIYIEQEGGSAGKEVMSEAIKRLAGYPVYRDVVSGSKTKTKDNLVIPGEAKMTRAMPLAAQVEAGNVRVCGGKFRGDFLEEMCAFPESSFFDQVDSASGAFNMVAKRITSGRVPHQQKKDLSTRLGTRLAKLVEDTQKRKRS